MNTLKGEKKVWEIKYGDGTVLYFRSYRDHTDDIKARLKTSAKAPKAVSVRRIKQSEMPEGATIYRKTKMKAERKSEERLPNVLDELQARLRIALEDHLNDECVFQIISEAIQKIDALIAES
jgi:hypothetical protein